MKKMIKDLTPEEIGNIKKYCAAIVKGTGRSCADDCGLYDLCTFETVTLGQIIGMSQSEIDLSLIEKPEKELDNCCGISKFYNLDYCPKCGTPLK